MSEEDTTKETEVKKFGTDMKYGEVKTEHENNFGENEPVFLIRARDLHSMPVLQFYAKQHDLTVKGSPAEATPENLEFVKQLNEAIDAFSAWQAVNETKIPD